MNQFRVNSDVRIGEGGGLNQVLRLLTVKNTEMLPYPREPDTADGVRQHVSQDGRERVGCGEVGVEVWVVPVGHLWKQSVRCQPYL